MTGVIATIPKLKFTGGSGAPLAGGTLTVYAAGTTTPENTWQDRALTIPNQNPIPLDGFGACVVWLDSTKTYKIVLKDSSGALQWTQDNISGGSIDSSVELAAPAIQAATDAAQASATSSAASAATAAHVYAGTYTSDPTTRPDGSAIQTGDVYFNSTANLTKRFNGATWVASDINTANLAASSGASLVGFVQSGTGAVARTLQAKARDFVTPEDFGAVGDGVTDDTAAMQAAMTAIATTFDSYTAYSREVRGAALRLTPGKTYAVDQLTPKGNVTVVAYGARLLHNATTSKPLLNVTYASMGLRWYGGMLVAKQSATNPTSAVLKLDATSGNLLRIAIRDVDLIGGESDASRYATAGLHLLAVPGVNGIYECEFENISARFVNGPGYKLDCNSLVGNRYLNNNTFHNPDIRNCALGIDMIGSEGNTFVGGAIQASTGKAVKFRNCRSNVFTGVWIEGNNTAASAADDPFDIDFTDATMIGSNAYVGGVMVTLPPRANWSWWKHFSPANVNHQGSATGITCDSLGRFNSAPNVSALSVYSALQAWKSTTSYALQACLQQSTTQFSSAGYWECTTAGTSGAAEPTWPALVAGNTVTDGTAVWTYRVGSPFPGFQFEPAPARIMMSLGVSNTTEWEAFRIKSSFVAGANTLMAIGPGQNVIFNTNSSAWDGGHISMGLHHLWVDAFGVPRVKLTAPTSAADGFPFGTKVAVPATVSSAGAPGQWAADTSNLYVYTGDGTTHTWRRVAVAAF